MAITSSPGRGRFWARLHFFIRFLGLTGGLVALVGLVLGQRFSMWSSVNAIKAHVGWPALNGAGVVPAWLAIGGAAAVALALCVEAFAALGFAAGRRSAVGFNSLVQVALGVAVLLAINYFAFSHSRRIDCTRDGLFTLPADLREQLAHLDPNQETTVIVFQQHKTFGALTDKPDRYDYAAERKVVEKVKTLARLLRDVGPQLKVEVLDVEEEGYEDKLKALTKDSPELKDAIAAAPENSIFIRSGPNVQRLSFNEFYQLDKVASRDDRGGQGNLVLLGQGDDGRGIRPLVRKILNLQQRRPRVGVLVIHEELTTRGNNEVLSLAGLRQVLETHGFDVRDVVLKKNWNVGMPVASADTLEESKLERLENELEELDDDVLRLSKELKVWENAAADLREKPGENETKKLDELSSKYGRLFLGGKVTPAGRKILQQNFERNVVHIREELEASTKERAQKRDERATLNVDSIQEARRLDDLKAKMTYTLADCDLLLLARMTRYGPDEREKITPRLHRFSAEQAEAVKAYLRTGKPLLACLGPTNEEAGARLPPELGPAGPDDLERLLGELGIRLGKQTVLFKSDEKALSKRRADLFGSGAAVEPPPLDFEGSTAGAYPRLPTGSPAAPNRLREGLRITARSVGPAFDIRLAYPRPIYYEPIGKKNPNSQDPTVLLSASGWNEDRPFATSEWSPRFTPPPPNDPDAGSVDSRRRGPFPVAIAVESPIPKDWRREDKSAAETVRVAVIGQGQVFVGKKLSPARERLFLQTANWLLGRDDYLPRADHPVRFPRVNLKPEDHEYNLWMWGARLGLPVLFAYLGFVVLLMRRLR
jgi:hypothetical protein